MTDSENEIAIRAFHEAIRVAGTQTALAKICGCTPGNISQLVEKDKPLSAKFVLKVEAALGISRHELRPDFYPREDHPQTDNTVPFGRTAADSSPRGTASDFGGAAPSHADEQSTPTDEHRRPADHSADTGRGGNRLGRLAS